MMLLLTSQLEGAWPANLNWQEIHTQGPLPASEEEINKDHNPSPRGTKVIISAYGDADHAKDEVTRRSVTGILIFLNCTLICWIVHIWIQAGHCKNRHWNDIGDDDLLGLIYKL